MLENAFGTFMVGFLVWGENEEIIHVNDKPSFSDHVMQGIIHETLEYGREVGEAKGHNCKVKVRAKIQGVC